MRCPCPRWLLLLVVLGGLLVAGLAEAQDLYVADRAKNTVNVYDARTLDPNPTLTLTLPERSAPSALAVTHDELFVAIQSTEGPPSSTVSVYSRTETESGGLRLLRTLTLPVTGFDSPSSLAVTDDELFVANQAIEDHESSITVYPRAASGDARPVRTLKGLRTTLSQPSVIAVDVLHNELFVANSNPGFVTVYERTADGNTLPKRTLKDPANNPLYFVRGLAVDLTHDELFVAYGFSPVAITIAVYHRDADFGDVPKRTFHRDLLDLDGPSGLALDLTHDELFVANNPTGPKKGFITVYNRTATDLDNPQPIRRLDDAGTRLDSPVAIAIAPISAFDYTLTNSGNVTVFPGTSGTTTITATLQAGSPTVGFQGSLVSGLPPGATASFSSAMCSVTCSTTLTITTEASTPTGLFRIIVVVLECIGDKCIVGSRSTSFDLEVGGPIPGTLRVDKAGDGTGTVTSNPSRIECGPTCSTTTATFPPETAVTLTARADPGSSFAGWGGGCSGTGLCTVTLTGSATVTATFILIRNFPLTVVKKPVVGSGAGGGTVVSIPLGINCGATCSATFPLAPSVTLTASADSGLVFAGWNDLRPDDRRELLACGGLAACTITITGDTTVEAYFGTPQEAFIARLYLNLLDLPPQNVQALIDSLTPLLTLPFSTLRDAFFDAFFDGPVFEDRLREELTPSTYVTVLFRALFARELLPEQRAEVLRGLFRPIVAGFIGSREFQVRIGMTEAIVRSFYTQFLGRQPTSAETSARVVSLNINGDFLGLALELLSSDEYQLRQTPRGLPSHVRMLYLGLFAREPTENELRDGTRLLAERLNGIKEALIDSPEFLAGFSLLFPGLSDLP
jgi:hypothetical protein